MNKMKNLLVEVSSELREPIIPYLLKHGYGSEIDPLGSRTYICHQVNPSQMTALKTVHILKILGTDVEYVEGVEILEEGDGMVIMNRQCRKCGDYLRLNELIDYGWYCEGCKE